MTFPEPDSVDFGAQQQLTCGADVDELMEQVADGRGRELTVHQQGCKYCQAALAEFAVLWAPVSQAAALPVLVPAGVTAALTAAVMNGVGAPSPPGAAAASGAAGGRLPNLGRWLAVLVGLVVLAALIIAIVPASRHHDLAPHPTPTTRAAPISAASTDHPPSASVSVITPPVTTPPPPTGVPTAVPAGSGGHAAPTPSGTRAEQLALLAAGVLLLGAGGGYLAHERRRRRS